MIVGEVVGNLWATIQVSSFQGTKLLLVQPLDVNDGTPGGNTILAVDTGVGAGIGDRVLVVYEGSSSRLSLNDERTPCEAIIVGIVDHVDVPAGDGLGPRPPRERGLTRSVEPAGDGLGPRPPRERGLTRSVEKG